MPGPHQGVETFKMKVMKAAAYLFAAFGCFLSVAFVTGLTAMSASVAQPGDYDADDDGLIEISTLEQLDAIRYDLNGDGKPDDPSEEDSYAEAFPGSVEGMGCPESHCRGYELTRDLDFDHPGSYGSGLVDKGWSRTEEGEGWPPIGSLAAGLDSIFAGNGHTVFNLYINRKNQDDVGLFSAVGSSGEVGQLGLVGAKVTGGEGVGALAGYNGGSIKDSNAGGNVSGELRVGVLVGYNAVSGSLEDSFATGNASGASSAGGLAGGNWGTIFGSHARSEVIGRGNLGGLAGWNAGTVSLSFATGDVLGHQAVGGLIGNNVDGGRIMASYATGNVAAFSSGAGGLVGENAGTITASYATGDVSGNTAVGGLVGANAGDKLIANYAIGAVSGSTNVGGLVGRNAFGSSITSSYARGVVTGAESVGGLIGENAEPDGVASNYWDIETSGQSHGVGFGYGLEAGGRTTAELQESNGYAGFFASWNTDIDNVDADDDEATGVDDPWDFGTSAQYPALKADFDGDDLATWEEFGAQPRERPEETAVKPAIATPVPTQLASPMRDYDTDNDGLIEVSTLDQLNAIRFDLNGDGMADNSRHEAEYALGFPDAIARAGCPGDGCSGYELARDVDFDDPSSYESGAANKGWRKVDGGNGWLPIGMFEDGPALPFQGVFEGNGRTITGLFVDVGRYQAGLFSALGNSGEIRNVGLVRADVSGAVEVGGLAGRNLGVVKSSYATGVVSGDWSVGGLVGLNNGRIVASYAAVDASGGDVVGGLVGDNQALILASYAKGTVAGRDSVGGLVGITSGREGILASYATGFVSGRTCVGGLVGNEFGTYAGAATGADDEQSEISCITRRPENERTRIGTVPSYWDVETSGHMVGDAEYVIPEFKGKTTAELQGPTGYAGIYSAWNIDVDNAEGDGVEATGGDDPWDFGTAEQYPALSVDFDGDGEATWQEFGQQRGGLSIPDPVPPTPIRKESAVAGWVWLLMGLLGGAVLSVLGVLVTRRARAR